MVRLKVLDLKNKVIKYMFQFQYGTIKREDKFILTAKARRFNSNMVRLKGIRRLVRGSHGKVSIPIWYD